MKKKIRVTLGLLFLLLASWLTFPGVAEVYKYKNEQGRWVFTDRPPVGKEAPEVKTKKKEAISPSRDLAAKLFKTYKPNTPVEKASLSVVAIHSTLGKGSGFFVSDDGYVLTNKHVVKPTETTEWQELKENYKEAKENYGQANALLRREGARLKKMDKELKDYRRAIDNAKNSYAKRMAEQEYQLWRRRYLDYKRDYDEAKRTYQSRKKVYETARREFNLKSSSAVLKKNFKIVLKDSTELTARLISTSKENDLALLKISRYQTPFIKSADVGTLRQGMRVFAIGNPLGIKNVMTSGVVSQIRKEYVVTDATVLPGSSGGPLVTDKGEVVGVNSKRLSQVVGGEGFGVAISMNIAFTEFRRHIQMR